MMKKVQEGFFAVEEQMPCSPNQITISKWALPGTLKKVEKEEAVARILSFSQQFDQWVGVSWRQLLEMMQADYELQKANDAVLRHNVAEQCRVNRETLRYRTLCIRTLGTYALFAKKPAAAQLKEVSNQIPFSVIFVFGPQIVGDAINDLINEGFLRHETKGEGGNRNDVFFPTSALISHIMQKQGAAMT